MAPKRSFQRACKCVKSAARCASKRLSGLRQPGQAKKQKRPPIHEISGSVRCPQRRDTGFGAPPRLAWGQATLHFAVPLWFDVPRRKGEPPISPCAATAPGSAELHSAVSRICNPPAVSWPHGPRWPRRHAEYNSAIQQIENLRYRESSRRALTLTESNSASERNRRSARCSGLKAGFQESSRSL